MGGKGSGRRVAWPNIGGKAPKFKRTFARKWFCRGQHDGPVYTVATATAMAPATFAWFTAKLFAMGHDEADGAAAFCTLMILYFVARFGGNSPEGRGHAKNIVDECARVVSVPLAWKFPKIADPDAHSAIRAVSGCKPTPQAVAEVMDLRRA